MEDRELIESYKDGDEGAYDELMGRYLDRIYRFARAMTRDDAMAEDAAQDTFIKAWKGLRKFDEEKKFSTWLFSIAKNATIDVLRKRRDAAFGQIGDGDSDFAETLEDDAPLPDIKAEGAELERALDKALATLGVEARSAVMLHDREGFTFEEIAAMSGEPMNTVKSRYRRALQALREALEADGMHQSEL